MALPSQSARPIRIRSGVGGKRRRRNRGGGFMVGVILLGAAGGATWWLWPESDTAYTTPEPAPEAASTADAAASGTRTVVIVDDPKPAAATGDRTTETAPATDTQTDNSIADAGDLPAPVDPVDPATEADPPPGPNPTQVALDQAAVLIQNNDAVGARVVLSEALKAPDVPAADADHLRATLSALNEGLVFSRQIAANDPFVGRYTVKSGDSLSRIVNDNDLPINWRFLQRLNGIAEPTRIGQGQQLKTIVVPFHAVVDKASHRLDLWLGDGPDAVYVRSFTVGLGEFDSTPLGLFRVRKGGKLVNPSWRNPRTGERFDADDPANPIGEYWIGLEGIEAHNLQEQGFGVHGTIDPDSIGKTEALGCVRRGDADIALLYGVLASGKSTGRVQ